MPSRSIVVVEDDPWVASAFTRELERAGFLVRCAQNGLEGMQLIDDIHPDVVVLDVFLPGPNGMVLLHELQSHSDLASIPIVICTTSAADIPKDSLRSYGVRRVLDKTSLAYGDVVAAVKRCLV